MTSSVTWPLDSQYMVSYKWSFGTINLSSMIAEILCVKHLAKHNPIDSITIFVLYGQNWRLQHFQLCAWRLPTHVVWALSHHSRPMDLVTLLRSDLPFENVLQRGSEKLGQNSGKRLSDFDPLTKSFFNLQVSCNSVSNSASKQSLLIVIMQTAVLGDLVA